MSHGDTMVIRCGRCDFEALEAVGTLQAGDQCPKCAVGMMKAARFADTKDLARLSPEPARPYQSRAVLDIAEK